MIRKIPVRQLRTGMYLAKLGVSWLKHPFARNAFLLEDPKDIATIVRHGISEVWIDTDKGLDVAAPVVPPPAGAPAPMPPAPTPRPTPRQAETARARRLCAQARDQVKTLFADARMGKAIDAGDAMPLVEEISASVARNPSALISVARIKTHDEYTYLHSVAVCALMIALARRLGLDEPTVREAGIGGLMHDLGKAMMPLEVLNKPGRLTDDEFAIMKAHPEAGWKLLREGGGAGESTLDIALHHHEKLDGSGYPHGLAGEAISLLARMGAVCDVYDAVTSERPYKSAWDPADAIRRMASWQGHFDDRLFQAFVRSVGIYPIGALVRTSSDRLAVVVEQDARSMLTPRIRVFFSARANAHVAPQTIDLATPACRESIIGIEDPAAWGFEHLERLWME